MVGEWLIRPDLDRIERESERKNLRPQVMELLVYLAKRPGEVVSTDNLLNDLWTGRIVTEGSLYNCISELRVALATAGADAPAIETIPKKGYRLVAPVGSAPTAAAETTKKHRWLIPACVALALGAVLMFWNQFHDTDDTKIRSLVILPLDNHSPDPEGNEYFTEGMTEALIARLGKIRDLRVISRTSAMQLKDSSMTIPDIAANLDVDGVIEGSVIATGEEVRVTLQLIDGKTDAHLWARSYTRNFNDILDLQEEIANAIADELHIEFVDPIQNNSLETPRPPLTSNAEAYRAYLKGRYAFNQFGAENFRAALSHYEDAVQLDPSFALAYASLAETCMQPLVVFSGFRTLDDCERDALTATARDDQLAEAYAALGFVRLIQWQWQQSESDIRRAIALDPNSVMARQWHAEILRATYRFDEALAEIRRAEEMDPLNLFVKTMVGWPLYNQRKYAQAMDQWNDVIEMDPGFMLAHYNQGLAYIQLRQPEDIFAAADKVAELAGPDALEARLLKASAHAIAGDAEQTETIIAGVERDAGMAVAAWIASIYLMLGDEERALTRLEKGFGDRAIDMLSISEPKFDAVRQHPRFRALSRRMGLPVPH